MPEKRKWTEEEDAYLRVARRNNVTWDQIATQMRVSRWLVIERAKHIGAWNVLTKPDRPDYDPDRDTLPPGHPITWGAITAGTVLQGAKYTFQAPLTPSLAEWKERAEWKSSIAQYRWVAA